MSKAIEILEEKLVPVAAWVAENKYVNGIRRAFIMMMPLLMIGSIFLMITAFPSTCISKRNGKSFRRKLERYI